MNSNEKEAPSYKWICLGVVTIGTFMAFLDTSIVNIAVNTIMASFGTSLDKVQWVLTGYMLASGAVIPLTGYLGDTFGLKKIYVVALIVFTIGSLMCGLSWNVNILIISRVIQAIGGGMIMPISMAMLYRIFPKELIGAASGIWGISAMAAPAIGPTLGGYIIQYLNWKLIFTINVPIGIIGIFFAIVVLKEIPGKSGKTLDYIGGITSTLGLVSILYVIGKGSDIDWSDVKYPLLIAFGCFNLIIFAINELTIEEPLLDLRMLKIPQFLVSTIITSILMFSLYGVLYLVPLFLQKLIGLNTMQTGTFMLFYAIGTAVVMPLSGKLLDKFGAKPVVVPGIVLMLISTYKLYFLDMSTSNNTIILLLIMRGAAFGLCMMPATNAGMSAIPAELVGRASALQNTIKQIVSSLSVTILTIFIQNRQGLHYYRLAEQFNSFNPESLNFLNLAQDYIVQKGIVIGDIKTGAASVAYIFLNKQSFMFGINDATMLTLFIIIVALPFAFMIEGKKFNIKKLLTFTSREGVK